VVATKIIGSVHADMTSHRYQKDVADSLLNSAMLQAITFIGMSVVK
jgi:hypothetical protein